VQTFLELPFFVNPVLLEIVKMIKVISENKYPGSVHRHRAKAGSFCCFSGIFFSGNHLKMIKDNKINKLLFTPPPPRM